MTEKSILIKKGRGKMKKKPDMDKLLKKYQPVVKKTGDQLSKAVKAAEEDVVRMYRMAQAHVDIQMKHLQKEKIYHEIGKYVAGRMAKGDIGIPGLEKFQKKLEKIDSEEDKTKKRLSHFGKKSKKSSKK